jgi:hypothetical protein
MLVAALHLVARDTPPALLWLKKSAGPTPEAAGAPGPKLRLFVSPVKPVATHVGAFRVPSFIVSLGTTVVPALKLACALQQSPTMFHSAVFQLCDKLTTLSFAVAFALPPGLVSTTVSVVADAVPVSVVPCSWAAVIAAAPELALLKKQLLPF